MVPGPLLMLAMARHFSIEVFLAPGNLEDLQVRFDNVRDHVENLVVLLSSETLKRMRCEQGPPTRPGVGTQKW